MEVIADPGDQWIRHFLNKSETKKFKKGAFYLF